MRESQLQRTADKLRSAFERLCSGQPTRLPHGAAVTQNNVAREAGFVPSALRGNRYPALVADIRNWNLPSVSGVETNGTATAVVVAPNESALVDQLARELDVLRSLLVEADIQIIELTGEMNRLKALAAAADRTR